MRQLIMDEMENGYKMLSADDKIVQQIIKQNTITPVKNGDAPVEFNSRVRLPETTPETYKLKKVSVNLTPEMQAVLIREGATKGRKLQEHLQVLVNELLSQRVGKVTVKSASFMQSADGVKVVGPSKSFGKDKDVPN